MTIDVHNYSQFLEHVAQEIDIPQYKYQQDVNGKQK